MDKRDIWFSVGKKIESIKVTPLSFLQLMTQRRPIVHCDPGSKYQSRDYNWSWEIEKKTVYARLGRKPMGKGERLARVWLDAFISK